MLRPIILSHLARLLLLIVLAPVVTAGTSSAQSGCPDAVNPGVEDAWNHFRSGKISDAERMFSTALMQCSEHSGALTGLGFARLRLNEVTGAKRAFASALSVSPENVDALTGLGLVAWREGDLEAVLRYFRRTLALQPDHPTALEYIARLPPGLGPPPQRPPLVRPQTLDVVARAAAGRLEVRDGSSWRPFYVKGMNLGAALPGRHASEFPDSTTYVRWIREMADMGVNSIRLYRIHPPSFYGALLAHNEQSPERAIWIVHGVWTELPENDDFLDRAFERSFFSEMRRVVDVVHGRADIRPGIVPTSGFYTADVSKWTLAYIIGREWEAYSVTAFDSLHADLREWKGTYLTVSGGNAMDAWLGKAVEHMVAYETESYGRQRPVAYTNWPTLDPLHHPTEPTGREEAAIMRALGEDVALPPIDNDDDGIGLDATLVKTTDRFPAGTFAVFHAYPYYPDFMVTDPGYREARSSFGPSNYFGYLADLQRHHGEMPVLIAEYGVPSSIGLAHVQNQGWHHGGLTELQMAEINRRMTLEIAEAGLAGGMLFAWIDEWFKKNWVVIDFEIPLERNRLWYNRLDAEQHYGMLAKEPMPAVEGASLAERLERWRDVPALYEDSDSAALHVATDEAYLWLLARVPRRARGDVFMIGFDMVDPRAGDRRWPGAEGPEIPVGLEFVLVDDGTGVRLLADPSQNLYRHTAAGARPAPRTERIAIENEPPGFFYARANRGYNLPYETVPNEDGVYEPLLVMVNNRRVSRDTTEFLGMGYDRGILPQGAAPDGLWERSSDGEVIEVRIPWGLLNVTDPSRRRILQGPGEKGEKLDASGKWARTEGSPTHPDDRGGEFGSVTVDDVRIVAAMKRGNGSWRVWPRDGAVARYTWKTWDEPQWRVRKRPTYDVIRLTFESELSPMAAHMTTGDLAAEPVEHADRASDEVLYASRSTSEHPILSFEHADAHPRDLQERLQRARQAAWGGDVDRAIRMLDGILAESPGYREALEARALFQGWAGRYDESISTYDQLLAVAPQDVGAHRGRARVLSWSSQFRSAREALDQLVAENPDNLELRLDLARVLAFSGALRESRETYLHVLAREPENVMAHQGMGRTWSWAGRLVRGERAYRTAMDLDPTDVGTIVGLGQNLRWQGRNAASRTVLREATGIHPDDRDVREQLRWVRASLGPQVRPTLVLERDSDENYMLTASMAFGYHPLPRLGFRVDSYHRTLEAGALRRQAQGVTVTTSYQLEPGWNVSVGVSGAQNDGARGGELLGYQSSLSSPVRHRAGASISFHRSALDYTALLVDRGVSVQALDGALRWVPARGWRMDGSAGRAVFSGSRDNIRTSGSLAITRGIGKWVTLGVSGRAFGFEHDLQDGYFDPDFYGLTELTGAWSWQPGPWSLSLEGAPGMQKVRSKGDWRPTVRASLRVAHQFGPGREISLGGTYASAGVQSFTTGESDYRYIATILAMRWGF